MNDDEARKVLTILSCADGGCMFCATELFDLFLRDFPEFEQSAKEIYLTRFESELDLEKEARNK